MGTFSYSATTDAQQSATTALPTTPAITTTSTPPSPPPPSPVREWGDLRLGANFLYVMDTFRSGPRERVWEGHPLPSLPPSLRVPSSSHHPVIAAPLSLSPFLIPPTLRLNTHTHTPYNDHHNNIITNTNNNDNQCHKLVSLTHTTNPQYNIFFPPSQISGRGIVIKVE